MDTQAKTKRYPKIDFLGEGQYATVYKAEDTVTKRIVAVKKIKLGKRSETRDGINRTALREIKILKEISHPNIISLLDVYFGQYSNVSLVFDYMQTDLERIIQDSSIILTQAHIKKYMLMTLIGLEYMHCRWILHRDIKPNNLLVNKEGILKITDFGLAKAYGSPDRKYTYQVVTRWYRSPELLYGANLYGTGIDIWATGCVLAELLLRVPFLQGDNDITQLSKICEVLGCPSEDNWPGVSSLPSYIEMKPPTVIYQLSEIFSAASEYTIDLLQNMLKLNPIKRYDATNCLKSSYFSKRPYPTASKFLPLPSHCSSVAPTSTSSTETMPQASDSSQQRGVKKRHLEELKFSNVPKKLKF